MTNSPRGGEQDSEWLHKGSVWAEFKWRGLWHMNKEGGVEIPYVKIWGMKQDNMFQGYWNEKKGDTHNAW